MAEIPRELSVGLGMVAMAFLQKLFKYDARAREYSVTVLGEESHLAYNRVGLTSFFQHRKVDELYLNPLWAIPNPAKYALTYHIKTKVIGIKPTQSRQSHDGLESFAEVKLVERNKWVLSRQPDEDAGSMVVGQVRDLGLDVMLCKRIRIKSDQAHNVTGWFGVNARDELAHEAGIECAGGGIVVHDDLSTSDPECLRHWGMCQLAGPDVWPNRPGVEMAEVLAFNLTQAKLHSSIQTTRSQHKVEASELNFTDPFQIVYKKYIFTADGKYLVGGMMIGDTSDYVRLVPLVKNMKELRHAGPAHPGAQKDGGGWDDNPTTTQSACHNVTKGDIVKSVKDGLCKDIGAIKSCTKAGTGCGGCMPLVTTIFNKTMAVMGNEVKNHLCSHFNFSRADLFNIIMVKRLTTLPEVMREAGNDRRARDANYARRSEHIRIPWNRHVMEKPVHGLQDTNDRFLGNIQRNGTYSVVPRVPGGEITPDRLLVIGEAKRYNLYTKITGQRIDMFGARKQDLVEIWPARGGRHGIRPRLCQVAENGQELRRHDLVPVRIGDSVGMAGGVSGCVRECAEAQSKDFGLIATEKGFNVFIAGNGGAKPRHAQLLAKDAAR
ncbi:BFD-like [2Fe-2S] binding domain-containing protein [Hirsutella rhossiliensis]|uniref:BFD-like [2Fe-2S] binding domain-containing protein n=1 Tax=Hirsutella rhossiliensis TaxID=111463 RepID=A0A9P8MWT8_9HYPO|nr:BFD-like [2Fe-2S] binding domain-containing protein [Hirsutella rhossiliensis]KAH0961676.1 BFD-like [2Fe-2S] binding domain-containing protein [Hirsutella rhossiliensis]